MSEQRWITEANHLLLPEYALPDQSEMQFDLVGLGYMLLAKWKLILCLCLICTLLAALFTIYVATPEYEAASVIYVLGDTDSAAELNDLQLGNALAQDCLKIFRIWEVHERVITNLNLPYTCEQMQDMLYATNQADTRMIDITITAPDPQEAALLANEYAKVASQFIAEHLPANTPHIVSAARAPSRPVSPNIILNVTLGFLMGAFISFGYILFRFIMTNKLKSPDDIFQATGMTTLAVVCTEPPTRKKLSRRHI